MSTHNISPSCQFPLIFCSFCTVTSPVSHFSSSTSFLSSFSSLSQNTNNPFSSVSYFFYPSKVCFLFLQKLIFPINFLCLNSFSSSLSMTQTSPSSSLSSLHHFTLSGEFLFGEHPQLLGFHLPFFALSMSLPFHLIPIHLFISTHDC